MCRLMCFSPISIVNNLKPSKFQTMFFHVSIAIFVEEMLVHVGIIVSACASDRDSIRGNFHSSNVQ